MKSIVWVKCKSYATDDVYTSRCLTQTPESAGVFCPTFSVRDDDAALPVIRGDGAARPAVAPLAAAALVVPGLVHLSRAPGLQHTNMSDSFIDGDIVQLFRRQNFVE